MVNEAVLIYETEIGIPFTVDNAVGIEKGTICALTDPMTAAASSAEGDLAAGIAVTEKIASDGKTKLSMFRRGIFKVIASGTIAIGDALASDGDGSENYIYSVTALGSLSGARIIGNALEAASDEETFLMELNITAVPDSRD